ncbi:MAG: hypothetical protein QN157_07185 [Armatimonadota bacterium]|nr:hypothetical protein [Armatimonadota bacterium]
MIAWVLVRRTDLARELTRLARLARAPQRRADAVLTFADRHLTITLPGMSAAVPADGTWVPHVRVQGRILLGFARDLPDEDPLLLKVQEGHLVLGGHAIPCRTDHPEFRLVSLPQNATLIDILRVAATHSAEDIARSGLTRLVSQAQARRRRLVARAATLLERLRITADDLDQLVEECLHGRVQPPRQPRERYAGLVARVASILQPLGVPPEVLDELVRVRVRTYWTGERRSPGAR